MPLQQTDVTIAGIDGQRISLTRVLKRLHLWDCQHCGKTLMEGPRPSLVFDVFGPQVQAALYHPYCRDAGWSDPGLLPARQWSTYALDSLLPAATPGAIPTLILNPSMEAIILGRSSAGVWLPIPLVPLTGSQTQESFHIEPVRAEDRYGVRVHCVPTSGPPLTFEGQVPEDFYLNLVTHGSATVLITHLYSYNNPMTSTELQQAAKAADTLMFTAPVKSRQAIRQADASGGQKGEPMDTDPRDVVADPLMQAWSHQIRTELHRAQDTGDPAALGRLLDEVARSGNAASTPGTVLALHLVELAIGAAKIPGSPDDPSRHLRDWAVEQELCTYDELETAWLGRILNDGLARGWLPALWHDALAAAGAGSSDVAALLDQIERRPRN
ncbi:hypothetical protein [Nocardiopsis synnemataformans]|uniref:hypothetical protein n=1 Tax=Nocardiopsis synnemataformans TaxID=61305 RepID=UPI003EBEF5DD